MGLDKYIVCKECNEYARLDKVPFNECWEEIDTQEFFNAPNYRYQTMKMISFAVRHGGCPIRYVLESSRYASFFYDVWSREESTEFTIDKNMTNVRDECSYEVNNA